VLAAAAGNTAGHVPDHTYERVCRARTGHAGAVEVWFDPAQVSDAQLLKTSWRIHNPATRNRQGFNFGSQYRSAIFS
jgi:peptide-methionine (S)-S-oxide reductase